LPQPSDEQIFKLLNKITISGMQVSVEIAGLGWRCYDCYNKSGHVMPVGEKVGDF